MQRHSMTITLTCLYGMQNREPALLLTKVWQKNVDVGSYMLVIRHMLSDDRRFCTFSVQLLRRYFFRSAAFVIYGDRVFKLTGLYSRKIPHYLCTNVPNHRIAYSRLPVFQSCRWSIVVSHFPPPFAFWAWKS